jgi:transcriptional regulator with XRE-family HTH domain
MKKIIQNEIGNKAGIHQSTLSNILTGRRRPSWKTAKRLSSAIPGSTPEQWLEAPPETLRRIINEYAQQERSSS